MGLRPENDQVRIHLREAAGHGAHRFLVKSRGPFGLAKLAVDFILFFQEGSNLVPVVTNKTRNLFLLRVAQREGLRQTRQATHMILPYRRSVHFTRKTAFKIHPHRPVAMFGGLALFGRNLLRLAAFFPYRFVSNNFPWVRRRCRLGTGSTAGQCCSQH